MKVPVAALRALLPLGSSLGAAIALTALYGLLSLAGYSFFAVWAFLPYLDSALGAGGAPAARGVHLGCAAGLPEHQSCPAASNRPTTAAS